MAGRRPLTGAPRRPVVAGLAVTVVAAGLVLSGALGPGVVLYRDDVQVPHPAWNDAALGLGAGPPRAVPYSGVLALLSWLLGAGPAQRLALAAPLLLVGSAVTVLLRHRGAAACSVAALAAVWNPYVAERLGLGQAPTLLAYSATAWLLVVAVGSGRAGTLATAARATVAFVPAALTPFGSVAAGAVLVVALLAVRTSLRALLAVVVGPLALCLPWIAALLVGGASGSALPGGAAAFAAADDTGRGVLLSVMELGGVWTPTAVPSSRDGLLAVTASLVVLVVAAAGWWTSRPRLWLALAWAVPVVVVSLAATSPAVRLLADLQGRPGPALLRDTHRLLGLSALAVAGGLGLAMCRVAAAVRHRVGAAALVALAAGTSAVCVLTVPDLPAAVRADYQPVRLPADWQQAVRQVDASRATVLSMPWQPLRRTAWSGGRVFLDPLPRAVHGPVLTDTALTVRRDGRLLQTDAGPPAPAGALTGRLDGADLAARGVRWVLEYVGTPGAEVRPVGGLALVESGPAVRLWEVTARPVAPTPARPARRAALMTAWGLAGLVAGGALVMTVVRSGTRHGPRRRAATRLEAGDAEGLPSEATSG